MIIFSGSPHRQHLMFPFHPASTVAGRLFVVQRLPQKHIYFHWKSNFQKKRIYFTDDLAVNIYTFPAPSQQYYHILA